MPNNQVKITAIKVKYEDGNDSNGKPNKEGVPSISTSVMNMEVKQEPTVLQIKGF